jgi:hypothetical protein
MMPCNLVDGTNVSLPSSGYHVGWGYMLTWNIANQRIYKTALHHNLQDYNPQYLY